MGSFFAGHRSQSFLSNSGPIAILGTANSDQYGFEISSSIDSGWFDGSSLSSNHGNVSVDHQLKDVASHQGGCSCSACAGSDKYRQPGDDPSFIDVPGGTGSTITLAIGSAINDQLEVLGDHDWFRVNLTAGQTYTFTVGATGVGDITDSFLNLRDSVGTVIASNDDISFPGNTYSRILFTATTTGVYFVDVGAYDDAEAGNYRISATVQIVDAIPGNSTTTASITVGGAAVNGLLDAAGDHDWFRVDLVAGQTYLFRTNATGGANDPDTFLRLYGTNGTTQLAENDDGGGGTYSQIRFTATTTGTYFLDVGGFDDVEAGNYNVTAAIAPPLTVYTNDQIALQLTNTFWGGTSRRFNVTSGGSLTVNITALTPEGQTLARAALALWTDFTGVTFTETGAAAQITFDDAQTGAFATSTRSGGFITASQVNVGTAWLTTYGTGLNTYSFQTYIHEIGHALGLGHAGPYNGTATYGQDNSYLNDAWATTVMSYFSQDENTYFSGQGFTRQFVVSPIVADAIAVGNLYGTPTTTRTGNTTYGFNNNSGRDIYNATLYPSVTYTIVDSGGTDTMDYSGFTQSQRIDLNQEAFSNIGGRVGNVTIARGTVIENAIGGSGADTIIGNSASNVLNGGGGINTLSGNAGNDTLVVAAGSAGSFLDGGADVDTVFVVGAVSGLGGFTGFERILFDITSALTLTGAQLTSGLSSTATIEGTGVLTVNMTTAGDFISKLFTFVGAGVSLTVNGTTGNDIFKLGNGRHTINAGDGLDQVKGGSAIDTINGGTGVDKINGAGGADILTGGTGADVFKYAAASDSGTGVNADQITDYEIGIDKLNFGRIDANTGIGGDQAFNFVGTGAFSGGGAGSIRYQNSGGNLLVQVDVDGNGTADMEIILAGRAGGTLTTADFVL